MSKLSDEERIARRKAAQIRWRKKNPARVAALARRYNQKNKEAVAARKQDYAVRNRAKVNATKRDWERRNPEKLSIQRARYRINNLDAVRNNSLRWHYSITLESYNAVLAAQGGVCAICRTHKRTTRSGRLFVDHNHQTGEVRALLCHGCNMALGFLCDNADMLRRSAAYLDAFDSESGEKDWAARVRIVLASLPDFRSEKDEAA